MGLPKGVDDIGKMTEYQSKKIDAREDGTPSHEAVAGRDGTPPSLNFTIPTPFKSMAEQPIAGYENPGDPEKFESWKESDGAKNVKGV
jgi:hypothetical protein